ncbi:I78 family peptidase inhibitor [Serpens gallinarum]|uniref:Peptidase inhibitor I78 family protein n=1 Tax=Serpens gallinarum TaxID=2763075 RepID=A0ABR8TMN6_9PSED|nr:I78 family peptidase inhibitor [Serpens gallinarum]MBD7976785.1 hypothetical protein [Serpens gallinarum]
MSTWFPSVPALLSVALLAGCASSARPVAEPGLADSTDTSCAAENVQDVIGKTASPELQEDARRRSGAERMRLLRPGSIVTLEFNHQRLNLHVDDQAVVQQVNCG